MHVRGEELVALWREGIGVEPRNLNEFSEIVGTKSLEVGDGFSLP